MSFGLMFKIVVAVAVYELAYAGLLAVLNKQVDTVESRSRTGFFLLIVAALMFAARPFL